MHSIQQTTVSAVSLFAGIDGGAESTDVLLDARIKAKQLPPPPFKNMVKGIRLANMLLLSAKWDDKAMCMVGSYMHKHNEWFLLRRGFSGISVFARQNLIVERHGCACFG